MEDLSFFERTRERYLALANQENNVVIINSMQSLDAVHKDISVAIDSFLDNL